MPSVSIVAGTGAEITAVEFTPLSTCADLSPAVPKVHVRFPIPSMQDIVCWQHAV
jgi:hypothetical protein